MKIRGRQITDTYGKKLFETYDEAMDYMVDELGNLEDSITEGVANINVAFEGARAVEVEVGILSSEDDSVYFINYCQADILESAK